MAFIGLQQQQQKITSSVKTE